MSDKFNLLFFFIFVTKPIVNLNKNAYFSICYFAKMKKYLKKLEI